MAVTSHPSGLPLPKEFEEKITDNGRKYFINHTEQTTTWVDPRDAMTKKSSWAECGPDECPYGWEMKVDEALNLKYWIDHNNQVNTVDDPRDAENRKEQETQLKSRVVGMKKSMGKNRQTLRKTKQKLASVKQAYDDIKNKEHEEGSEVVDSEATKQARLEYRRQLSLTNRVQRVVDEGEAKINALEAIKFDEMSVQAATDAKKELAQLNENYEKELEEKQKIKQELAELKELVAGYMQNVNKTIPGENNAVRDQVIQEEREEMITAKSLEKLSELTMAEEEETAQRELEHEQESMTDEAKAEAMAKAMATSSAKPSAESSIALKIELEQRKLERERQLQETAELKAAQRELRLLKEKAEANSASANFHTIEEADLPDWLFSSHVVKLLDIEGEKYDNDDDLQDEIKAKVKGYMQEQKEDAEGMNFKSKLAFFTTLEIHNDVERRISKKNSTKSGKPAGHRRTPSMTLKDELPAVVDP